MDKIELFCGAGGGLLAGKILGHTPVLVAEIANYPRGVLKARVRDGVLPASLKIVDDVRKVDGTAYKGVDILAGGFPCQDISAAGKGVGIDGERSGLVWEMLRVADESQARYVFAENSPRLRAKGLNRIIQRLTEFGYGRIAWGVVGGRNVGAPHQRDRMWLLAKRGDFLPSGPLPVDMPKDGLWDGQLRRLKPLVPRGSDSTLPTLISSDAAASGNRPNKYAWSLCDVLGITAKFKRHGLTMPTLAATDWKSPYGLQGLKAQLAKRSKPLRDVLPFIEGGRSINPAWAEWYMGWAPGWTSLVEIDVEDVREWGGIVKSLEWWTDKIEEQFLPRTLKTGGGGGDVGPRIKALGNGQIPLCAAVAFNALKEVVG